jgi:hypothetical protein
MVLPGTLLNTLLRLSALRILLLLGPLCLPVLVLLLGALWFRPGLLVRPLLLLGLIFLSALLILLCISRSTNSNQQCQSGRSDDYCCFHANYLDFRSLAAGCSSASFLLCEIRSISEGFIR